MYNSIMHNRYLIFGNGQLGNFYLNFFRKAKSEAHICADNITKIENIRKAVESYKPNVVINTAAKTNLEWCALNKLEAFNVNVLGADNIAQVCSSKQIYFVQLSSGCILASKNGSDLKKEEDSPAPISYYSWTKVWAEQMISFRKEPDFKYLILRPRQPISARVNYKNMLMKLLTFSNFIDEPNSGTAIEDLMQWTSELVDKRVTGVVNVANDGWTTPYQIGLLLKKHILPSLTITKISKKRLDQLTPEKRVDTILDVSKLKSLVKEVKPYKQRVEELIIELGENIKSIDKETLKTELEKTVAQSKTRTIVNNVWEELLK